MTENMEKMKVMTSQLEEAHTSDMHELRQQYEGQSHKVMSSILCVIASYY